jgi:exosortase/archaeosortase family protein
MTTSAASPAPPAATAAPSPFAFVLRVAIWVALFFGFLRIPWVQDKLLLPFADLQGDIACSLAGTPRGSVFIDLSCTGSDAMALCLGAIFAFPASWRQRIVGGLTGLLLISVANTVRIGSVSLVLHDKQLFDLLHVYVWPAIIIVIAAFYVFLWMRWVSSPSRSNVAAEGAAPAGSSRSWRFAALTVILVIAYYGLSPWFLDSALLLAVAHRAAQTAGVIMNGIGIEAKVVGGYLRTSSGGWLVTQDCVATPLVPIYLAALLSASMAPWKRLVGLLTALPLFTLLGTSRLLVLAVPTSVVGSHEIAVHAFYQLLLGVVAVVLIARYADSGTAVLARALGIAVLSGAALQVAFTQGALPILRAAADLHLGHAWADPQGALLILPAFQIALWTALWWVSPDAPRRVWAYGVGALLLLQVLLFVLLGEAAVHLKMVTPVIAIRLLAIGGPLVCRGLWARDLGRDRSGLPSPA